MSPWPSANSLPISRLSQRAISSTRSRTRAAAACRTAARSPAGVLRPGSLVEGAPRRQHGGLGVFDAAVGDARHDLFGGRIDDLEQALVVRVDPLAVDVHLKVAQGGRGRADTARGGPLPISFVTHDHSPFGLSVPAVGCCRHGYREWRRHAGAPALATDPLEAGSLRRPGRAAHDELERHVLAVAGGTALAGFEQAPGAERPRSLAGTRIVVSGGSQWADMTTSSKPTTLTSAGMREAVLAQVPRSRRRRPRRWPRRWP